MFDHVVALPDRDRQLRLFAASTSAAMTCLVIIGSLWYGERLAQHRVEAPRQPPLQVFALDLAVVPERVTPPAAPAKTSTNTIDPDPAPVDVEDPDPAPSNPGPRAKQSAASTTDASARPVPVPGPVATCPPGITCSPAIGPRQHSVAQRHVAPSPPTIDFQRLACLACPDPSAHALRRVLDRGAPDVHATVAFCVDARGTAYRVRTTRSSRRAEVDHVLVTTVQRWRFRPYRVAGRAHATCSEVEFRLRAE